MMIDLIVYIVRFVSEIVRMGCDFLGWSTVWVRNAIKERDLQHIDQQFKIPSHLGVSFTEKELITMDSIVRFLDLCIQMGIRRVTLYDPWGECLKMRRYLEKTINNDVEFLSSSQFPDLHKVSMAVQLLSIEGGNDLIVESIKELLSNPLPLTSSDLNDQMCSKGVIEPEMLLKVGNLPTMAGYPPLSLRVTEIVSVVSLPTTKYNFHSSLLDYSKRDIRLGR